MIADKKIIIYFVYDMYIKREIMILCNVRVHGQFGEFSDSIWLHL